MQEALFLGSVKMGVCVCVLRVIVPALWPIEGVCVYCTLMMCVYIQIADFGMSRDLADETYYISSGGKIPVKWTAPEALHYKKYSTASDVWSFGCLMYEIWSLGHKPLEGYTNVQVYTIL